MTERKTRVRCIAKYGTATVGKVYSATIKGNQVFIDNLPTWTAQPLLVLNSDGSPQESRGWNCFAAESEDVRKRKPIPSKKK